MLVKLNQIVELNTVNSGEEVTVKVVLDIYFIFFMRRTLIFHSLCVFLVNLHVGLNNGKNV